MMIRTNNLCRFLLLVFLVIPVVVLGQQFPQKPEGFVNDYAHVLSPGQVAALDQKLSTYRDSTSNEIAIMTVDSLQGYPIDEFSLKVLDTWKIGQHNKRNGILIFVAVKDRKMRIEVGYGLEGVLPDILAGHIVRNILQPNFRNGNFYQGFDQATTAIMQQIAGEYTASKKKNNGGKINFSFWILLIIAIVFYLRVIRRDGPNNGGNQGGSGRRRTYGSSGVMFFPGWWGGGFGGGGGWGGGGFGGGGFGGFSGGGGFAGGGGGASGGW